MTSAASDWETLLPALATSVMVEAKDADASREEVISALRLMLSKVSAAATDAEYAGSMSELPEM